MTTALIVPSGDIDSSIVSGFQIVTPSTIGSPGLNELLGCLGLNCVIAVAGTKPSGNSRIRRELSRESGSYSHRILKPNGPSTTTAFKVVAIGME